MRNQVSHLKIYRAVGVGLAAILLVTGAFSVPQASAAGPRPAKWAQPVASTAIHNWHKIHDGLYRSRQPDRKGFEAAKKMGIRTIVNLRSSHSDAKLVEGLGFNLVEIPMLAYDLSEDRILAALKAIQAGPQPVLVHCQQGSDRAGVVSATYRVVVQGWTKDEAIDELKNGGYGFHRYYLNIPAFIRNLDVAKFQARLAGPVLAPRVVPATPPPGR